MMPPARAFAVRKRQRFVSLKWEDSYCSRLLTNIGELTRIGILLSKNPKRGFEDQDALFYYHYCTTFAHANSFCADKIPPAAAAPYTRSSRTRSARPTASSRAACWLQLRNRLPHSRHSFFEVEACAFTACAKLFPLASLPGFQPDSRLVRRAIIISVVTDRFRLNI